MAAIVQSIVLEIDGVGKVNAQLRVTQSELDKIGAAAGRTDARVRQLEAAWDKAERSAEKLKGTSRSLGQQWDQFAKPVSKVQEALSKVNIVASTIGGIFGGAAIGALAAFKPLWDLITDAEGKAKRAEAAARAHADAMKAEAERAEQAARKISELAKARDAAAQAGEGALAGMIGAPLDQLSLGARVSARQLGATRAQQQARMAEIAARVEALTQQGMGIMAQERTTSGLGRIPLAERAARITNEVRTLRREYEQLQQVLARDPFKILGGTSGTGGGGSAPERKSSIDRYVLENLGEKQREAQAAEDAARADADARMDALAGKVGAESAEEERQRQRDAMRKAHASADKASPGGGFRISASNMGMDNIGDTFKSLANEALSAAALVASATAQITQSFGQMWTNLILSGSAGAKGFKRFIGDQLAGLSAQAFGYATLLAGMALAAALTGPIMGHQAPGLAAGAAVMAGTGAALALTAKALGASASGGFSKGGGGGEGGGSKLGAGRMSGAADGSGGNTNVTVVVGISRSRFHDAMIEESDSRASSRGRRAVAVR